MECVGVETGGAVGSSNVKYNGVVAEALAKIGVVVVVVVAEDPTPATPPPSHPFPPPKRLSFSTASKTRRLSKPEVTPIASRSGSPISLQISKSSYPLSTKPSRYSNISRSSNQASNAG